MICVCIQAISWDEGLLSEYYVTKYRALAEWTEALCTEKALQKEMSIEGTIEREKSNNNSCLIVCESAVHEGNHDKRHSSFECSASRYICVFVLENVFVYFMLTLVSVPYNSKWQESRNLCAMPWGTFCYLVFRKTFVLSSHRQRDNINFFPSRSNAQGRANPFSCACLS